MELGRDLHKRGVVSTHRQLCKLLLLLQLQKGLIPCSLITPVLFFSNHALCRSTFAVAVQHTWTRKQLQGPNVHCLAPSGPVFRACSPSSVSIAIMKICITKNHFGRVVQVSAGRCSRGMATAVGETSGTPRDREFRNEGAWS